MQIVEPVLADVSPALEKYEQEVILKLWTNSDLSSRDRSIVTVAALIAKNQMVELPFYLQHALDHRVTPAEVSEIITHLAFYSGWSNAVAAINVARPIFKQRKVFLSELPKATPEPLPIDTESENLRAAFVQAQFGEVAPDLVQNTTDILFRDLWLRPDLAPRDRSLVTVSALIAMGAVAQIPYHLNRAMDYGLTEPEAAQVIAHLAFYVGWPNSFSALPVMKDVFKTRNNVVP